MTLQEAMSPTTYELPRSVDPCWTFYRGFRVKEVPAPRPTLGRCRALLHVLLGEREEHPGRVFNPGPLLRRQAQVMGLHRWYVTDDKIYCVYLAPSKE